MNNADTYKHKGLRKRLVAEIKEKGIYDISVLNTIEKIPRHLFMDSSFLEFAYQDKAFPIGEGQTISQPYTVAFQTQLLQIKKGQKILEIGTGSGYQTCVLLEIGAKVYSIERIKNIYQKTKQFLPSIGYQANLFYGDGYKGLPTYGPFDGIVVTAGAPFIPEELKSQLKIGGRLVIPVGSGKCQTMTLIIRQDENTFERHELGDFAFVPMLKGTN